MKRAAWSLLAALALCQCRDPQGLAARALAAKGRSLSVPEFFRAAREGDAEALKLFVAAGVAPDVKDAKGSQALREAAKAGKQESIDTLLALGATLPADGAAASALLSDAVRSHSMPTVNSLLKRKVKPAAEPVNSPLATAATEAQREMIEALLPECAGHEDAALLAAAEIDDVGIASTLIRAGASIFARAPNTRRTPLMIACGRGHKQLIEFFLTCGANRWAVDNEGFIAAEHAQAALHADIARNLQAEPSDTEKATAPRLQGAKVPVTPKTVDLQLAFTGWCEPALPFTLESIAESTANLKLESEKKSIVLAVGAPIPETLWKLDRIKFGGAVFRKRESTERLMLVPGVPARDGEPMALVRDYATSQTYEATKGDTFTTEVDPGLHITVTEMHRLELVLTSDGTPPQKWTLKLGGSH